MSGTTPQLSLERPTTLIECRFVGDVGGSHRTVQLTPDGEVATAKGNFIINQEAERLIVEALRSHGNPIPVDFEHQTLGGEFASPSGLAPAATTTRRDQLILSTSRDYDADENDTLRKLTARREYVDLALREAKLKKLTDNEVGELLVG